MNPRRHSKFLSLVLRHRPEEIGLTLDREGWASVEELVQCANRNRLAMTAEIIREIVETNDKQRFSLSPDGTRIRANQGHSIPVDLGLVSVEPPENLYHGTVSRFLGAIFRDGLLPGSRQHVHLSENKKTATKVGSRRGKPVILRIRAADLHQQGEPFYRSKNGVWLTARVPSEFLSTS